MATVKDYVKYYKDISFQEIPFNDIDSLIFSQIVYADFEHIIPAEKGKYILFSDAARLFLKKYNFEKKKSYSFDAALYGDAGWAYSLRRRRRLEGCRRRRRRR